MLCWIAILGDFCYIMGQYTRSEWLFYYFRLEDHIPGNHLLRLIDRHIRSSATSVVCSSVASLRAA